MLLIMRIAIINFLNNDYCLVMNILRESITFLSLKIKIIINHVHGFIVVKINESKNICHNSISK